MVLNIIDPYKDEEVETCSVSVSWQQQLLDAGVTSPQTEAQFNKSKLLGEWGVITAKLAKGEIPTGTKVLTYVNNMTGARGYLFAKGKTLYQKSFSKAGAPLGKSFEANPPVGQAFINSSVFNVSIPQAVSAKPKPEPVELTPVEIKKLNTEQAVDGVPMAVNSIGSYVAYDKESGSYGLFTPNEDGYGFTEVKVAFSFEDLVKPGEGWLKPDNKPSTPKAAPKFVIPPAPPAQVAAPVPSTPVNSGSSSVGSMSHEDVSALFVKIKDDLAKEQGLNIKGANPGLDLLVYQKIADATGYKADEVKGKIDAYKAAGNKLSALKKKVLAGTYKVPATQPKKTVSVTDNKVEYATAQDAKKLLNQIPGEGQNAAFIKNALEAKIEFGNGPGSTLLVAKKDGQMVGAMTIVDHTKDASEEGLGPYILIDFVGSKAGSGSATDMIREAIKIAKNKKAIIMAEVTDLSEGYWKKQGFKDDPMGEGAAFYGLTSDDMEQWLKDHPQSVTVPDTALPPQPTKASPAAPLNTPKATNKPAADPKPNGVPTVATPKLADTIKAEVKKEATKEPAKVYTDEDVAAQYIIAKDAIVVSNTKGWTLYTKNPEFDKAIADTVQAKTGLNSLQQKQAIANYLASGKKLSALKKQLAKQGAFKPQADTLKSGSKPPANAAAKAADVNAKADSGYTPTPTPAAGTPPIATGKPAPKKVEKQAEHSGDISGIPANTKKLYFDKFKATGSKSWLSSGTQQNYEGFAVVLAEMQKFGHSKNLTMLQLIRVIDEEGAKKAGVANGHLFEKQVATWLTTPEGTKYIKDRQEEINKKAAAAAAAAEAEANQPPLPPDSAQFEPWSLDKAKKVSATWLDNKPWSQKERRDLVYYTGSAYTEMNTWLRKGKTGGISDRSRVAIDGAKAGMRPTTEPILVQRGSGAAQFSSLGIKNGQGELTFGTTGKTFVDEGFLSTSAGGSAAFGGECKLEIECPVGTPMAYVAPISKFPHENEMLLQAGMTYKVLNVRKVGSQYVIRMRVVDWPGKED